MGVISLVVYFYYFMSLLASVVLNKLLLRLYDYCNLVYIVRVGNKDNNDYSYNSIIQIILQMQGGGSGFSVLFFFFCISSFTWQTLALVQGETLLAAALGNDHFEN